MTNLATVLDNHPEQGTAIISRGRSTDYGTLRRQVASAAGGFAALGLTPGDRVGIVAGTNWYFVVSYLAVLHAGCVAVPLSTSNPARAIQRELAAVGAKAVFVGPTGRPAFAGVDTAALPELAHVIATEGHDIDGAVQLEDLLAHEPVPAVDRAADDLAVLIFTSGTAGSPKAAMLSHGNLLANLEQVAALEGRAFRPDDVVLGVLPLSHIFGLNVALGGALHAGASIVLIERFDPASALEAMARHGVTVVMGAPTMWATWAQLPGAGRDGFAKVRLAASGAARLDPAVADACAERFGIEVAEGYGLTEASPVVTSSIGGPIKRGSIGVPVPGLEVRLVDADGTDSLAGDPGEIWVRGPNVFQGYWNDPDATAAAVDGEGWLHTGDIAVVDDDGALFIVDRAKDLIIVSGFNVFPAEVEEVLLEHPGITAAAVVGVVHPHTGEAVKAFVVVDGGSYEEDEIIAFCGERLARYKCPTKVMFVDEIPTGLTGKVLRNELR